MLAVRVRGIEPPTTAWKAVVLPLNYTRKRGEIWKLGYIFIPSAAGASFAYKPATRTHLELSFIILSQLHLFSTETIKEPGWSSFIFVMGNSGVSLYMYLHIYSVLPPLPDYYIILYRDV